MENLLTVDSPYDLIMRNDSRHELIMRNSTCTTRMIHAVNTVPHGKLQRQVLYSKDVPCGSGQLCTAYKSTE